MKSVQQYGTKEVHRVTDARAEAMVASGRWRYVTERERVEYQKENKE